MDSNAPLLNLTLLLFLLALLVIYVKRFYGYWNRMGVPTPTIRFPYGNATEILRREMSLGDGLAKAYREMRPNRYCGYYMGLHKILLILDPDLIKTITTNHFDHFSDHGNYINEKNDPLTGQLFMLKGQRWRTMRANLTPAFSSAKMKTMFPILVSCARQFEAIVDRAAEEDEAIEIKDVSARYTTDTIGSCAFGLDCNSLNDPDSEFRRRSRKVFEMNPTDGIKRLIASSLPWIMDTFKICLTKKEIGDFFARIVRQTVEHREKSRTVRNDFVDLLMLLKNRSGLTMDEITAQAFGFFIARFETSSTVLGFCFYELASNCDFQEKLRAEIQAVLGKNEGKLTYEALSEMSYMDACIYETLRKYPPVPFLIRGCTKDYKIPFSNVYVEKGTRVFVPLLGLQRDPEFYPNPDRFDPERFSAENKVQSRGFTWLPFGEGPRACIGIRFGMMQTKVALAMLLNSYRFEMNSKTQIPLIMDPKSLVMSTIGGIWLNAKKIPGRSQLSNKNNINQIYWKCGTKEPREMLRRFSLDGECEMKSF